MAIIQTVSCDIEDCDMEIRVPYATFAESLKEAGWTHLPCMMERMVGYDKDRHFCPDHKLKGQKEDG